MQKTNTPLRALASGLLLLAAAFPAFPSPNMSVGAEELPASVTRAEAAMILLKTRVSPSIPFVSSEGAFPDVSPGSWYERYMALAVQYRIITPQPDTGLVRPNAIIIRAEFLKMLAQTFALPAGLPHSYQDVPAPAWYARYAGIATRFRLFPSDLDGMRLLPESPLSHEEVAHALQLLLRQIDLRALSTLDRQLALLTPEPPVASLSSSSATPAYADVTQIPGLRREVVNRVNAERSKYGIAPLRAQPLLDFSAQQYAEDMVARKFFSHVTPTGGTLSDRILAVGYDQQFYDPGCKCIGRYVIAENIARGQKTPQEVIASWMRSPSHRTAILSPAYAHIGVGIKGGMWVQHFGGGDISQ